MKQHLFQWILFFLIVMAQACSPQCTWAKGDFLAPASLDGRILEGTMTSEQGSIENLPTYQFFVLFDKNHHFRIRNKAGELENEGTYQYQKVNKQQGELLLTSASGTQAGMRFKIILSFTAKNEGVYEAFVLPENQSQQTGTFNLK